MRTTRSPVLLSLAAIVCLLAATEAGDGPRKDGKSAGTAPAPESDALAAQITKLYKDLEKSQASELKEGTAVDVRLTGGSDAYLHGTSKALMDLLGTGVRGKDLIAKAKAACAEWRPYKGEVLFTLTLTAKQPCYLTGELRKHIALGPRTLKPAILSVKPPLNFEVWKTIIDSTPGTAKLAEVSFLTITFTVPRKDARKVTTVFTLSGLMSQRETGDPHAGINKKVKQVSFKTWADVTVPPIKFSFEPSRWEDELPAQFADLLKALGEPDPSLPDVPGKKGKKSAPGGTTRS